MICKNCGAHCADGMKFCVLCGAALEPDNQSETPNTNQETTQNTNQYANQNPGGYFSAGPSNQPSNSYYQNQGPAPAEMTEDTMPENLRPLSLAAVMGYLCLFSLVPCAGFICAIIFAVSDSGNINRKRLAGGWLLFYLISFVIAMAFYFTMYSSMVSVIGSSNFT